MTIRLPRSASPEVSVLVLATRRGERFVACLEALASSLPDGPPTEVIVVLNAAAPDVRAVMEHVEGARVLSHDEDLGTAACWNLAADAAAAPRVSIVHEDARPQHGWLSALVEVMDGDPYVAVAGATLLNTDGSLQNRGWITWDNGRSWPIREQFFGAVPEEPVLAVDLVSSATALIDRAHWDEVGGFDESFFPAVGVDIDLGWSAWARGRTVVSVAKAKAFHDTGAMVEKGAGLGASEAQRRYLIERSERLIAQKWARMLDHGDEPPVGSDEAGPQVLARLAHRRAQRRQLENPPRSDRWLTRGPAGEGGTIAEIESRAQDRRRAVLSEVVEWTIGAFDTMAQAHDALLADHAELHEHRHALSLAHDALRAERDALTSERDLLTSERDRLVDERSALVAEREQLRAERDSTAAELAAIRATRTWRLHDEVTERLRRLRPKRRHPS